MDHFVKEFQKYVTEKGLRRSGPRELVVREFFKTSDHISIENLQKRVQKSDPRVGIATIYRTLNLLMEAGLAVKRDFANAPSEYEKTPTVHHDHLLCTVCGKVVEFRKEEIERLQDEVAARYGFVLQFHKMELYGKCRDCRKSK